MYRRANILRRAKQEFVWLASSLIRDATHIKNLSHSGANQSPPDPLSDLLHTSQTALVQVVDLSYGTKH